MKAAVQLFIKKYGHIWTMSYLLVYLPWYAFLEKTITSSYHVMHVSLDDLIPFNEYFIVPYMFWFVYILFTLGYFFLKDKEEYLRYGLYLAAGMSICLFICQIFPNGTDFRPVLDTHKNWATALVDFIYRTDTCTNVFPSIHVYNSIGTHIAICKSKHFVNKPWVKTVSGIVMVAICTSTVVLKQHSIIDVSGAVVLSYFAYQFIYSKVQVPVPVAEKEKKKVWA